MKNRDEKAIEGILNKNGKIEREILDGFLNKIRVQSNTNPESSKI